MTGQVRNRAVQRDARAYAAEHGVSYTAALRAVTGSADGAPASFYADKSPEYIAYDFLWIRGDLTDAVPRLAMVDSVAAAYGAELTRESRERTAATVHAFVSAHGDPFLTEKEARGSITASLLDEVKESLGIAQRISVLMPEAPESWYAQPECEPCGNAVKVGGQIVSELDVKQLGPKGEPHRGRAHLTRNYLVGVYGVGGDFTHLVDHAAHACDLNPDELLDIVAQLNEPGFVFESLLHRQQYREHVVALICKELRS